MEPDRKDGLDKTCKENEPQSTPCPTTKGTEDKKNANNKNLNSGMRSSKQRPAHPRNTPENL